MEAEVNSEMAYFLPVKETKVFACDANLSWKRQSNHKEWSITVKFTASCKMQVFRTLVTYFSKI